MAKSLVLETTGNSPTVTFSTLGGVTYTHPATVELLVSNGGEFEDSDILLANAELVASVTATDITLTDGSGNDITDPSAELAESVNLTGNQSPDGIKRWQKNAIVNDQGLNPTTGYALTVQDVDFSYVQFLTTNAEGGATRGGFVGLENNGAGAANQFFTIYNTQGGPIVFLTGPDEATYTEKARINAAGDSLFSAPMEIRTINAAAGGLTLNTLVSGSSWDIFAGSTANFDNWLRFSNSGSANPNEAVLTNLGAWRVLNGSAGAPGHAFINGSNYGMSLQGANDILALSAAGTNRITFNGTTGDITVPSFGEGVVTSTSAGVLASVSPLDLVDKQFVQSQAQQTINFGAGGGTGTAYTTLNNSSITALNTAATDYEITASFLFRITNNNNRTVQFAIFVNAVVAVEFQVTRVDQANDDKSYTRRWNLNIPAGATIDWRVRNINLAADFQLNDRNFTIEEF